jgi:glycosyltransferase involved in cell wall biosynthesis
MHKPVISIVMPVLNRGDMLETAIQSVLIQDYPHVELIIIDGGSTDNSIEIIRRYEKHITYWHSKPDGSAALATNIGIEKASGDLIGLLMADDYYEPHLFRQIAQSYLAHQEADIFTCAGKIISFDEKNEEFHTLEVYDSARELRLDFYNICYGAPAICFRFIKKSLYEKMGLYIPFHVDQKQMLTNDKEFLLRAVLHGVKNQYVDYPGYTHVAHEGSFSFGNHRSTFERHCVEHMDIAARYLSQSNLSLKHKLFLKGWYLDQSAKLFLFLLWGKKLHLSLKSGVNGVRKYPFSWPVMMIVVGFRALVKQAYRVCRSAIS